MDNKQAAALIIENIAMLEEANSLLEEELNESIFSTIDKLIKDWSDEAGWVGDYNFSEGDTWFGPSQWQLGGDIDDGSRLASYWWSNSDTDNWWLTMLLAAGAGRAGFRFEVDRAQLPRTGKRSWRAFAIQKNQEFSEIEKAGFQFEADEGTWFLPWKLDAKLLAENYVSDSIEDALGPVREALKKIEDIHPTFLKIVEAAQQQFGPTQELETNVSEA